MRIANALIIFVLGIGVMTSPYQVSAKDDKAITLTAIGSYSAGPGGKRAEIAAYDPDTKRIFAINLALLRIDVLDISDPAAPALEFTVPLAGAPNSVAIRDGVVAVAIENVVKTSPGFVQFFTTGGLLLSTVTVRALPDMITFTPNGKYVLVANEGRTE